MARRGAAARGALLAVTVALVALAGGGATAAVREPAPGTDGTAPVAWAKGVPLAGTASITPTREDESTQPNFYLPAPRPGPATATELGLFEATNAERQAAGLEPLAWDGELAAIGRVRAQQMADQEYFAHTDPFGYSMYAELLEAQEIAFSIAGENLALNNYAPGESAERAASALMASPLHQRNMLEERFTRVGIGEVTRADGVHLYAMIFLG